MNYFQIEQPINNYLGHSGTSYKSCGLGLFHLRAHFSKLKKKKKKVLNPGLLKVEVCALDVTDIDKNQPKPETTMGFTT